MKRLSLPLLSVLALLLLPSLPAQEAAKSAETPKGDATCLECHSDDTLSIKRDGKKLSLFTDQKLIAESAHNSLSCVDCHENLDPEKMPHASPVKKVDCLSCHEKLGPKHRFHPGLSSEPVSTKNDASCTACHGTHRILAKKHAEYPFSPARQTESCGRCHQKARSDFLSSAHVKIKADDKAPVPGCLSCHKESISAGAPSVKLADLKLAQIKLCESCHVHKTEVAERSALGAGFVASFDKSVHGAALIRGVDKSASCVDCHGAHEMNRAMVPGSKVNALQISQTCGKCHPKDATEYDASVHAAALRRGSKDSPSCTRCHGEHDIKPRSDPSSPTHAKNLSQQVCASCHASLRLTTRYGLSSDRFETFADSYHGLAVRGGGVEVVNCASCHGFHEILSQKDERSGIHKSRIAETCGRCHPGANKRFAVGAVHVSPNQPDREPVLFWIATLYIVLIVSVVGGMFLHNLLDFIKKAHRKLQIQQGLIAEEHVAHKLYLRMSAHERLQHATLVISFVLLVITGFMLRYPESWWVQAIRQMSDSAFAWRGIIHRLAGVVMLMAGVWHMGYLAFTPRGRQLFRDLLPNKRDLTDPLKVLRFNLGLASEKPKFDRFCYIEKAEYWALVWGTLLMGATGVILWFDNTSMGLFTKLGFDIARTVHYFEAILATLAILVWHIYFVVFNPDVYPMNLSWLTGRMSEREMKEEHPLELERLKQNQGAPKAEDPSPPPTPEEK